MRYIGTEVNRDIFKDMLDYMPSYYWESFEAVEITKANASEFERLHDKINDLLDQFFIDTVTWGIDYWEKRFNIPVNPIKPIEERRSLVKSKLRGYGSVSSTLIKNMAESFSGGEVSIAFNPTTSTVEVTFIGTRGVPTNMTDIQNAISDIIPAHLGVSFSFTYLTWDTLESKNWNWNTLDSQVLTWDQFETLK